MVNAYDVNPSALIEATAQELKRNEAILPPEWSQFVRTGASRERLPTDKDWWYVRSAAVLRSLHRLGPVGVSKLRSKYGGRQRRGVRPNVHKRGYGKIIRTILQQLEAAGFAAKADKGVHKGRICTPAGKKLLDNTAHQMTKNG